MEKNPTQDKLKLLHYLEELSSTAQAMAEEGNFKSAAVCFETIIQIDPENDENWFNLGLTYQILLHNAKAAEAYQKAVTLNLLNSEACSNLAALLVADSDYERAAELYNQIIKNGSSEYGHYYNLAFCFHMQRKYEEAIKYYSKAYNMMPENTEPLRNSGLIYLEQKNYQAAENEFNKILNLQPENTDILNNLGHIKLLTNNPDKAECFLNKALKNIEDERRDIKTLVFGNTGVMHFRMGRYEEALRYYNMAIEIEPEALLPHYNKAQVLLLTGMFTEGWKEYEWRKTNDEWDTPGYSKPLHPGQSVENKRILVYAEQGYGDTIQFIRYLPMLKETGCHLIFECEKELFPLLNDLNCIDEITEKNGMQFPADEYDYDIPLMSLPRFFGTEVNSIPDTVPYIKADEYHKAKWAELINEDDKLNISLVWAGNPGHSDDINRSCSLNDLLPLLELEGIKLFNLQKGRGPEHISGYEKYFVNPDNSDIQTFADTAAIIECMDAIVTVDTAVAHLAGAMGKQVIVLLPYVPDWRWQLQRSDSPWYKTASLCRQESRGQWKQAVIAAVSLVKTMRSTKNCKKSFK